MQAVNTISSLESAMPFLSTKEKKLGNYVLTHSQEILLLTSKGLSLQVEASEATVIRFTHKLGCKGYSDFELSLSANLSVNFYNESSDMVLDKIMPTDTPDSVLKKLSASIVTSIQSTMDIIDSQELNKAIKLIWDTNERKRKIYLSGLGINSIPVKQLQIRSMRLNIPVAYYGDVHLQLESNLNMAEDDLPIYLTVLGKPVRSHQYVSIANRKKAKVILITQYGDQELASKATVTLLVSAVENNLRLVSHTALIVRSLTVDTLFLPLTLDNLPEIQGGVVEKNRTFSELGYNMNGYK